MKRYLILALFALIATFSFAQDNKRQFDPAKFEEKLEKYVIAEAQLTPAESQKVMPLFRQMRKAVKDELMKQRFTGRPDSFTDEDAANFIKSHDACEVKIKQIQQKYHLKFLGVISAKKTMKIIFAEEKFMQDAFGEARARKGGNKGPNNGGRGKREGQRSQR